VLTSDYAAIGEAVEQLQRRQFDIASARTDTPVTERTADDELRDLAAEHPTVAAALGVFNAGWPVVPLDAHGEPTAEPMRSAEAILAAWTQHPEAWPGRPCGPDHDLVAAAVADDGWDFLKHAARIPDDTRPSTWARDDGGYIMRDLAAAPVLLTPPPTPARMRTIPLTPDLADEMWFRLAKRSQPRQLHWLCWTWPTGRKLPLGRSRRGIRLLHALPAETAQVTIGEQTWRVANGIRPHAPMPDWLADVLSSR
jgi:hypothetical protein